MDNGDEKSPITCNDGTSIDLAENTNSDTQPKEMSLGKSMASRALRPFVIISSSYLLFTITDGAIRMIVLLHAYNKGFSALEVAIMFTLYEFAGVVTNLVAGFMGAKWGIKVTLIAGLLLQLVSYGMLFGWNDDWDKKTGTRINNMLFVQEIYFRSMSFNFDYVNLCTAIIYVTIAQMFAGIAKDLTKLGGKTITKLVTPEEQNTFLFKLVSLITGWKNSLKGVGYFAGSALLNVSYEVALGVMMGIVALALPWALLGLDPNLGTAKTKNATLKEVFKMDNHNLNVLSLARLFLFASRDFWFEVPLPFYLRSPGCIGLGEQVCDVISNTAECVRGAVCDSNLGVCINEFEGGGCGGLGLDRTIVGAFLGGYIILYGQVQSWTPQLITGPLNQT
jgi:MFS family permease